MTTPRIKLKDVLKQLKADAIGKDSHRGVTLTYSWLANQFGHFSLGFIPTILISPFILKYFNFENSALTSAYIVSLFWLLFESYNFLGPLLTGKNSKTKRVFLPEENKSTFRPAWGNIAFDTFTDLLFFWIGAFCASLFMENDSHNIIILIILVIAVTLPARYWFLTKIYLQNTYYPYQFRLSQWTFPITKKDKESILRFLDVTDPTHHLIIFGSKNKGKTSLSVAISTELSIKHKPCLYTTASKIYCDFSDETEGKIRTNDLWSWRNCSVLIIDDINPGPPINDLITSEKFIELIDIIPHNRKTLCSKQVIWVLGEASPAEKEKWKSLLIEIGISEKKIVSIEL